MCDANIQACEVVRVSLLFELFPKKLFSILQH